MVKAGGEEPWLIFSYLMCLEGPAHRSAAVSHLSRAIHYRYDIDMKRIFNTVAVFSVRSGTSLRAGLDHIWVWLQETSPIGNLLYQKAEYLVVMSY